MKFPKYEIWSVDKNGEQKSLRTPVDFILMSDLHYGFSHKTHDLINRMLIRAKDCIGKDTVFLLAGDIISASQKSFFQFFTLLRTHYPDNKVVFCYGNHDFWETSKRFPLPSYEQLMETRKQICSDFNLHDVSSGILSLEIDRRISKVIDHKKVKVDGSGDIYKVAITGFDGWYWHLDPPTNDKLHMLPAWDQGDPFSFLNQKAHKDLETILSADYSDFKKKLCITHFPPFIDRIQADKYSANRSYMSFLTENFDILCVGHSHRKESFFEGKCLVLNAGGLTTFTPNDQIIEYPKMLMFNID
jgi:predicted phosphodiesterase